MTPPDKKKVRADQIANLRRNIPYLRSLRNWSQYEMAEALQINRSTIAGWERTSSVPKADTLRPVAETFNITINQILNTDLTNGTLKREIPEVRQMEDTRVRDLLLLVETQKELIESQRELLDHYRKPKSNS